MIVDGDARHRNEKRNRQEPYRESRAHQRQGKEQTPEVRRVRRGERRPVRLEALRIPAARCNLERPQAGKDSLEHSGHEPGHQLHAPDEHEHPRARNFRRMKQASARKRAAPVVDFDRWNPKTSSSQPAPIPQTRHEPRDVTASAMIRPSPSSTPLSAMMAESAAINASRRSLM